MSEKRLDENFEKQMKDLELGTFENEKIQTSIFKDAGLFQKIFEQDLEGIFIASADRHLLKVNEAICRMFGYSRDALLGLNCSELIHPEERAMDHEQFQRILTGKKDTYFLEKRFIAKDGSTLYTHLTVNVLRDTQGVPKIFVALLHDITRQKGLEKLLEQKSSERRLLIDTLPVQVWYLTDTDTYGAVNKAHADFLGYHPRDLAYKRLDEFVSPDESQVCREGNIRVFESRREIYTEEWLTNAHGENRLIGITKTPLLDDEGNVMWVVCTGVDITQRRRAENALQESEAQKAAILDGISNNLSFVNEKLEILWVNKSAADLINRRVNEVIGYKCHEFWGDPDFPCEGCPALKALSTKKTEQFIKHTLDGRVCEVKADPVFDREGKLLGVLNISNDITQRNQMEAALAHERDTLALVIEGTNAATWEWYVQTGRTVFNDRWADMLGYSLGELEPTNYQTWCNFYHPEDLQVSKRFLELHFSGKSLTYEREYRMRHKDGHWIWIKDMGKVVRWSDDGKPQLMTGIHMDITERKLSEIALHQSEEKHRNFLNNLDDGAYETDDKGNLTYVNKRTMEITEKKLWDLIEKPFLPLFTEESQVLAMDAYTRSMNGEDIGPYELEFRNGTICQFKNSFLRDKNNKIIGIYGIMRDITKQCMAEQAVRESEKKFRTLFDSSPLPISLTEIETGMLFDVNDTFCRLTKFDKKELLGKTTTEFGFYSQKDRSRFVHELKSKGSVDGMAMDFKVRDGFVYNALMFAVSIRFRDRTFLLVSLVDVTDIKRLGVRVQQAQRMQAIATLAGGVAHEFNNALSSVMGNMELLRMDLSGQAEYDGYLEAMEQSGLRMTRLTQQLLAYARAGNCQMKRFEFTDFVAYSLLIVQHGIKSSVRIETHLPDHKIFINADQAQMQMVLSALVTNSDESMEDGGVIRVTLQEKTIDKAFLKGESEVKPGSYACLAIEDNGNGMGEEEKHRLFDPFFTTKFQGRGMGMAAVYGIVKTHGGWICVDSKVGTGTTISICLPMADF